MEENQPPASTWSPSSALKKFIPGTADEMQIMGVEGLLDIAASPFKPPQNVTGAAIAGGSPIRSTKRPRTAPHSPGTALLIEAAKVTEARDSPVFIARGLAYVMDSPETALLESGPLDFVTPPSPARTPSRLLFSPKTESRAIPGLRNAADASPATAVMQKESEELIGSIWKHTDEDLRKTAGQSTARRPLLQQTASLLGSDDDYEEDGLQYPADEPAPAPKPKTPVRTPGPRTPANAKRTSRGPRSTGGSSAGKGSSSKKGRKTYSTAGRPRVRGEYKCGKCGHYPKKEKHDCAKVNAKREREAAKAAASTRLVTPSPLRKSTSRTSRT